MFFYMGLKLQISGITTNDALSTCLKYQVDYLGVVFYNLSPRNTSFNHATQFAQLIPSNLKKVAVVVNPDATLIKEIKSSFKPDYFQFDDNQSAQQLQEYKDNYGINIIKTIYISDQLDINLIRSYESVADGFLFESQANAMLHVDQAENNFNWSLLRDLETSRFWFLSGGLNKYNLGEAVRLSDCKMVSASSTLESSPGIKDIDLLDEFLKIARSIK